MLAIVNSKKYGRDLDVDHIRDIHGEGVPFDHIVEEAALLWYRSVWHGVGTISHAGEENVSMWYNAA